MEADIRRENEGVEVAGSAKQGAGMSLDRRGFLIAGAATAASQLLPVAARAEAAFPNKPIRIVVPWGPGGQTDVVARAFAESMTHTLGQPVIVENKSGGNGIIGAVEVKRSAPDGYTLVHTSGTQLIAAKLTVKDLPYDAEKDFRMVSLISQAGLVFAASNKTGASNLKEFVAYAKKNDKVSMGSYAVGSPGHLFAIELNKQYGLNIEAVHYRGEAPMWADVAGQTLDAAVGSYNAALSVIQSGRGKALAATRNRLPPLPDLPTMIEQGARSKYYELVSYVIFAAPAGIPNDILTKLSDAIVVASKDQRVKDATKHFFLDPPIPAAEAQKTFFDTAPVMLEYLRAAGLAPE